MTKSEDAIAKAKSRLEQIKHELKSDTKDDGGKKTSISGF